MKTREYIIGLKHLTVELGEDNMGILNKAKLFILDLDGTIYLSSRLIEGAADFLRELEEKGRDYIFLTNNSSRSAEAYVKKLGEMGLLVPEEKIMTSGKATTLYLKEIKPHARIFLLGTPSLEEEFRHAGFQLITTREEKPDYVVFGFDQTLTYEKIRMACDFILEGAGYIATHPDINCPLADGKFMIDTGAFLKAIEASIGRVPDVIIGKPNPYIFQIIRKKTGHELEELCMVGDRLYTDIRGARDMGILSVLVLSGETDLAMAEASSIKAEVVLRSVADFPDLL